MDPELIAAIKIISRIDANVIALQATIEAHVKSDDEREADTKLRLADNSKRTQSLERSRALFWGTIIGVKVAILAMAGGLWHLFSNMGIRG